MSIGPAEALLVKPRAHGRSCNAAGYVCILFLVVAWIAQSEVAQEVEASYDRPYIMTYICHSLCMLQGVLLLARGRGDRRKDASHRGRSAPMTSGSSLVWVVLAAVLYQLADWVWYIGLSSTSVADGTIIFNTMPIFVFVLEWVLGKKEISLCRSLAVLTSLLGVLLIEYAPGANNALSEVAATEATSCFSQLQSNALILLAAFLYALYQVCVDSILPDPDSSATDAFLSLQGAVTLVGLWPGAVLLGVLPLGCHTEALTMPGGEAAAGLAVNGLLNFAFSVLFCYCIVLTSPLITSVGCLLTVPGSLVADLLLHGDGIGPAALCGSTLVVVGFVGIADWGPQGQAEAVVAEADRA